MKSRQAKEDDGKKEFRLVRIKNPEGFAPGSTAVGADLGIFIARSPQAEVGCPGYYVAHIVQDGVVKRFVPRPRYFSDFGFQKIRRAFGPGSGSFRYLTNLLLAVSRQGFPIFLAMRFCPGES